MSRARKRVSQTARGNKRSKGGGSIPPKKPSVGSSIKQARDAKRDGNLRFALEGVEEGQKIEVPDGIIQMVPIFDFDWAQLLLSNLHPLQRTPRQAHVNAIARALTEGKYVFTGDSFKIDQKDQLIDGQHRCLAVLKANIPIKQAILMTINNDVAYRYIDTVQKPRGNADIWRFMGHMDRVATTVFSAITMENGDFKRTNYGGLTKPERYEIVRDYKNREEAIILWKASPSRSRVPAGPLAGALRCVKKSKTLAMAFFTAAFSNEHMVNGVYCPQAKLLATWILSTKLEKGKGSGESVRIEGAEKAIRAWNAFREGRNIRKLIRGDKFPKPR